MSFLKNYLIYEYNDITYSFIKNLTRFTGKSFVVDLVEERNIKADFLVNVLKVFLSHFIHPVALNNLFFIIAVVMSVIFMYLLFKRLVDNKILSLIFSLIYSFSIYFFFRVMSATVSLGFIFIFPGLIFFLNKKIKPFILGIIVSLFSLISFYYGYFAIVVVFFWYFYDVIIDQELNVKYLFSIFKKFALFILPIATLFFVFFSDIVTKNLVVDGSYKKTDIVSTTIYRPIEDYYNFSFRPWYFFIPPESSVFFGDFSDMLFKKIKNTGYYLADDYAAEEMAGAYMGWHFLIGLAVVLYILIFRDKRDGKFKNILNNKDTIKKSYLIILSILLISGPPSFTVFGQKIYTASYLVYFIIPVFRVLTRWSVVIFLFTLIINVFLVMDIMEKIKKRFVRVFFITFFVVVNLLIFSIKLPTINLSKPPEEIEYFDKLTQKQVKYEVVPSANYHSIFWILKHRNFLLNPPDYLSNQDNSGELSLKLFTLDGLKNFKDQGGKYVIVYESRISDDYLKEVHNFSGEINTSVDVKRYLKNNFGKMVYNKDSISIYRLSENYEK